MGNSAIKADSEFGDKISSKSSHSCDVNISPTFNTLKSSALSDTLGSFEDAVSITTDSTPSTTEYESANENDAKRLSSGSDIPCDFTMDTKFSTSVSNCTSVNNDWATTSSDPIHHYLTQQELPPPIFTLQKNQTVSLMDHYFVPSPNSVVKQQRANIETLDQENQLYFRSRDHRSGSKVKKHEETFRRTPAAKKSSKYSRQVVDKTKKKHSQKKPVQRSPVVHNDFFIFSYNHVFKELSVNEARLSISQNPLQKISHALSDTISKVSLLLDNAESREPSLTLPHFTWTWLLNVRASHVPFFEFNIYNVHLFRSDEESLRKLEAADIRRFFAEQTYLDLVLELEFIMKACANRMVYVVDTSKSVSLFAREALVASSVIDEDCFPSKVDVNFSNQVTFANSKQFHSEYSGQNEGPSANQTVESANLIVATLKTFTDVNNVPLSQVQLADKCIENHLYQLKCVTRISKPVSVTESSQQIEEKCCDAFDILPAFIHNELISGADFNSNTTSLELVDGQFSTLAADETEEFDSCVTSMTGGPVSEGWSDICSSPSENSFAFPSLKSEILQCAFQLDSINSESMNCNENVSEAGPATAADLENINNIPFLNDSSELDYISKIGGTGLVAENLRKQSLYVKFDPLVGGEGDVPFNGDATLKLEDTLDSSKRDPLNDTLLQAPSEEKRRTSDVNESLSCENGTVGKLISVTPNRSPGKITPRSSPRFPETDPDDVAKFQSLLLKQMKKEEAFKEEIDSLKRDYDQVLQKLQNAEKEISHLKAELESTQENEKKLRNDLKERIKSKQQLSVVMGEYEKTISQMLTKRDEEKKEFEATIKKVEAERDSTVQHLNNLENAFNDIHQKYERGKVVNEALKKNEELLQKSITEYETTVKTVENKYELLKSHATSQLEKANQELELITQSYEKEQAKLKAMLRKSEIQINSLQNALERKTKENQELTAICDELIVKLSTHSKA